MLEMRRAGVLSCFLRAIALWLAIAGAAAVPNAALAQARATHEEVEAIRVDLGGPDGKLETLAMNAQGQLLAAVSWPDPSKAGQGGRDPNDRLNPRGAGPQAADDWGREYAIRVITPEGKQVDSWALPTQPAKMLHANPDGTVYVAGGGRLSLIDKSGRPQRTIRFAAIDNGQYAQAHASGITATDEFVFLALGDGFSLRSTEDIARFSRRLTAPKVIISQQFGCCSHIDLEARDNVLLIAENSRHRVNRFSFEGKHLGTWGRRDRGSLEGFAACCNPVNMAFGPDGALVTAESGVGRVKRYTADGTFLGLVGYVDTTKFDNGSRLAAMSCYIPVEVSLDGRRVFVMDVRAHTIRVLEQKS